jgi:methylmalonyl-CoA/ethylmalonyl-CoA epimerase
MLNGFVFHHIGYATDSILLTSKFYISLGYNLTQTFHDSIQNVNIAFLKKDNFPIIELVERIDENSPVSKILDKNGVTPYHVCYAVEDMDEAIIDLRKNKFIQLFEPVSAAAINNKKICYFFNSNVGLIELLEK